MLKDNSSKFGTLLKVNKKDLIIDDKSLYLQAGRTSLEVQISKKWNWFGLCFRNFLKILRFWLKLIKILNSLFGKNECVFKGKKSVKIVLF